MKIKWIGAAIVVVLIVLLIRTLYTAGTFTSIQNHFEGRVLQTFVNMPGTEDLDIDREQGLLFISSSDRWKNQKGQPGDDGIYLLDLNGQSESRKLTTNFKGEFHPHGISFLKKDSISYLFVINHNKQGNFVEKFIYRNDMLDHIKTIDDPALCCPNDVVAVDSSKFYVTNDHGSPGGMKRTLEDYLVIPRSYLLYYNGQSFSKAWTGISYGNGVNVSADCKKLFLATTTGRTLYTFNRNTETGELSLVNELNLESGLDNISVDPDGTLWIASHPKLLAFVGHAKDPNKKSPSQILQLTPENEGYKVKEIYLNDGTEISGSSIALHFKNEIFVGDVFESKLLRAELAH